MTLRSLSLFTFLGLYIVPAFLSAQETSSKEDERIEQLVRSEASEFYTPKNSISVGFRVLSSGGRVRFGNLGVVPFSSEIAPASAGPVERIYNNGFVHLDAPRPEELDANGNQTSTPGGRYPVNDFLSYTPGLTREWSYSTPEQSAAVPGYVGMSSYSSTSDGGSFSKKQGMSAGVELQVSHTLRRLSKRVELSFVMGFAINGINNKTSGDVKSTLVTNTDYYSLNGLTAPEASVDFPYLAPSTAADGFTENTVPISAVPDSTQSTHTAVAGAATVHGIWQVKGAYVMVRMGPSVHAQITDRFGLSASLGLAGAYAGTHYTAVENLEIPLLSKTISDPITSSDKTKFLSGYYADLNVDWTANDTLGIYGGISAQKFGDYTQTLGDRNALIDLGNSVGVRGGVNIKF